MGVVCPTVTATTTDEYREQLESIAGFAQRIHIDLGDGIFTTKHVDVADVWWPKPRIVDIHLMYSRPLEVLDVVCALNPDLVIVHAEMKDDPMKTLTAIQARGIRAGIALLQQTPVVDTESYLSVCDHALIFSGSLGSFGGNVDFSLLQKIEQLRSLQPDIEIGWDGGIDSGNIRQLSEAGIDVFNTGGFVHRASQPENAYLDLVRQVQN